MLYKAGDRQFSDSFGPFSSFIVLMVEKLSFISYNYSMSEKKKILKIYQDEEKK